MKEIGLETGKSSRNTNLEVNLESAERDIGQGLVKDHEDLAHETDMNRLNRFYKFFNLFLYRSFCFFQEHIYSVRLFLKRPFYWRLEVVIVEKEISIDGGKLVLKYH
jgi:hypothetical protein